MCASQPAARSWSQQLSLLLGKSQILEMVIRATSVSFKVSSPASASLRAIDKSAGSLAEAWWRADSGADIEISSPQEVLMPVEFENLKELTPTQLSSLILLIPPLSPNPSGLLQILD